MPWKATHLCPSSRGFQHPNTQAGSPLLCVKIEKFCFFITNVTDCHQNESMLEVTFVKCLRKISDKITYPWRECLIVVVGNFMARILWFGVMNSCFNIIIKIKVLMKSSAFKKNKITKITNQFPDLIHSQQAMFKKQNRNPEF